VAASLGQSPYSRQRRTAERRSAALSVAADIGWGRGHGRSTRRTGLVRFDAAPADAVLGRGNAVRDIAVLKFRDVARLV
jgi:hypothetical protein